MCNIYIYIYIQYVIYMYNTPKNKAYVEFRGT